MHKGVQAVGREVQAVGRGVQAVGRGDTVQHPSREKALTHQNFVTVGIHLQISIGMEVVVRSSPTVVLQRIQGPLFRHWKSVWRLTNPAFLVERQQRSMISVIVPQANYFSGGMATNASQAQGVALKQRGRSTIVSSCVRKIMRIVRRSSVKPSRIVLSLTVFRAVMSARPTAVSTASVSPCRGPLVPLCAPPNAKMGATIRISSAVRGRG